MTLTGKSKRPGALLYILVIFVNVLESDGHFGGRFPTMDSSSTFTSGGRSSSTSDTAITGPGGQVGTNYDISGTSTSNTDLANEVIGAVLNAAGRATSTTGGSTVGNEEPAIAGGTSVLNGGSGSSVGTTSSGTNNAISGGSTGNTDLSTDVIGSVLNAAGRVTSSTAGSTVGSGVSTTAGGSGATTSTRTNNAVSGGSTANTDLTTGVIGSVTNAAGGTTGSTGGSTVGDSRVTTVSGGISVINIGSSSIGGTTGTAGDSTSKVDVLRADTVDAVGSEVTDKTVVSGVDGIRVSTTVSGTGGTVGAGVSVGSGMSTANVVRTNTVSGTAGAGESSSTAGSLGGPTIPGGQTIQTTKVITTNSGAYSGIASPSGGYVYKPSASGRIGSGGNGGRYEWTGGPNPYGEVVTGPNNEGGSYSVLNTAFVGQWQQGTNPSEGVMTGPNGKGTYSIINTQTGGQGPGGTYPFVGVMTGRKGEGTHSVINTQSGGQGPGEVTSHGGGTYSVIDTAVGTGGQQPREAYAVGGVTDSPSRAGTYYQYNTASESGGQMSGVAPGPYADGTYSVTTSGSAIQGQGVATGDTTYYITASTPAYQGRGVIPRPKAGTTYSAVNINYVNQEPGRNYLSGGVVTGSNGQRTYSVINTASGGQVPRASYPSVGGVAGSNAYSVMNTGQLPKRTYQSVTSTSPYHWGSSSLNTASTSVYGPNVLYQDTAGSNSNYVGRRGAMYMNQWPGYNTQTTYPYYHNSNPWSYITGGPVQYINAGTVPNTYGQSWGISMIRDPVAYDSTNVPQQNQYASMTDLGYMAMMQALLEM